MANQAIGGKLKQARELRGLGVNQLGVIAGVSGAAISRWERGERQPRLTELMKVLEVLNVSYEDLFSDIEGRVIDEILEKRNTSSHDIKVVLGAHPALSPSEIDVIMRIVESKERELSKGGHQESGDETPGFTQG